jgi:F-type H+-transporting ATPase subunit a
MHKKLIGVLLIAAFAGIFGIRIFAQEEHHESASTETEHQEKKEFESADFIMHHIADDYIFPIYGDLYLPLPVIIFVPGQGLDMFFSGALMHPGEDHLVKGTYYYHHGELVIPQLDEHGHMVTDEDGHVQGLRQARLLDVLGGNKYVFYNFSITKNVFGLLLSITIMLVLFFTVARTYRNHPKSAPKGLQGAIEPLILFVKDQIALPSIGEKKYMKFFPYLLTLFFFIWINNLLGLLPVFPGSANVSGNIAFTMVLALLSLILVLVNGNRNFWQHVLWPPGIPVPVRIMLAPIEIMGVFTKPFALMIRLFANMTAGHIIILSIIGLTFIMNSIAVGIFASLFSVFMFMLELLVGAIQAYIFVLITALIIGQAVEEPHTHSAEGHHNHS